MRFDGGADMNTLYERRGRRYFPTSEMFCLDALPAGSHLVTIKPGSKTVLCNIDPDHAALIAASAEAKGAMCAAIQQAMAREPNKPLTPKQRKIMDEFVAAGGFPVFSRKAAADVAKAGIDALIAVVVAKGGA
jgi:hypothetical protein